MVTRGYGANFTTLGVDMAANQLMLIQIACGMELGVRGFGTNEGLSSPSSNGLIYEWPGTIQCIQSGTHDPGWGCW